MPYARALVFRGASPANEIRGAFSGQCLLVRREAYVFLGGHGAVVAHLAEDVKLTSLAERHRLKLATARATGSGPRALVPRLCGHPRRNRAACVSVHGGESMDGHLDPLRGAARGAVAAGAGVAGGRQGMDRGSGFCVAPDGAAAAWYRNWPRALLAPVAIYGMFAIAGAGAACPRLFGRPVQWKGRTVRAVS